MLRSVRNDATQRTFWLAPISENFMALYYDLPVFLFCAILIFCLLTRKAFRVINFIGEARSPLKSKL